MIRSMTAFARREIQHEAGQLSWELRTLNHRYLEISPHLPEELRPIEPEVRARVNRRLGRGKVDLSLRFRAAPGGAGSAPSLNQSYVEQLVALHHELSRRLGADPSAAQVTDLLRWPGVVEEPDPDMTPVRERALSLLDEALDELVATREREGAELGAAILDRLGRLEAQVTGVQTLLPEIRDNFRKRIAERLAAAAGELDPGRLEQEIALLAQKADVDEELDRTLTHAAEIRRVLELDEPVGRRLDFLMQELNREANTLGSKSPDSRLSQASVELKVLIEQMREQVQNIE